MGSPARLTLFVLGLLAASQTLAGPFTVFGPELFRRGTGAPQTVTRTVTVLNPNVPYLIRVRNGGENGQVPRVAAATVVLNGVQVFGPAEINRSVGEVSRVISLRPPSGQTASTLSITVQGAPAQGTAGAGMSVTILGNDDVAPTITAAGSPAANGNNWNNTDVTVTFTCTDATSGIQSCPAPVVVSTEGSGQVVNGTAVDRAGNSASTSLTLNIDKTSPVVTASAAPAPNGEGWNNSDVTVSFDCQDALSGVESCPAAMTVSQETSGQDVEGVGTDRAGNTGTGRATVRLDRTAPQVTIDSPPDGGTVDSSPVTVSGTVTDALSGVAAVSCNGAAATLTGSTFTCSVPVVDGPNTVAVSALDRAANSGAASITVNRFVTAIAVTITSPASLALFRTGPITVEGTLDRAANAVVVNGVDATVSGLTFRATGVALREGHNVLTATATGPGGSVGTGSVTVTMDATPPTVRIDTPTEGAVVTAAQLTVTGMINDIVSGTVNGEEATVTVNGVAATIANRSFVAAEVLLARGQNTLTALARDRAGNESQTQIHVTFQDVAGQQRIEVLAGDNQSGVIGTTLPQPLLVGVVDAFGRAIPERPVTFTVARTDGIVKAFPDEGRSVTVVTDDRGQASVLFQLGTRTGAGNNQVSVTSSGFVGEVTFSATATVGPPVRITADAVMGESFRGAVGVALPEPFVAMVFDEGGNPVAGVPVTFDVALGGGRLDGDQTSVTKTTNSDGKADATLTLGTEPGINNNVVTALFEDLAEPPVTFTATGLSAGAVSQTRVSGVVLDNTDTPIPNARARISGTSLEAFSNDQGQFTIPGVPVGTVLLEVDGATSTRPETFPMLAFHLTTVAGQDNTVGMPIYLPPLDTASSRIVGGDQTVELSMAGVPGVVFTVFPRSATFRDGSRVGRAILSQVHADKVPMPPPFGTAPRIMWTLQPAGARFDPPIRVQLPNTDGLPPGQVIELFQFDHDIEQFVSVGAARVTPDGSAIVSDPGFGVTKAGWGGAPPPPPPKKPCVSKCDDGNVCNGTETCDTSTGTCKAGTNAALCTACTPAGRVCDGMGTCATGVSVIPRICSQLGITYANQVTLTCPGTSCGAGIRFDITGVTHSCDAVDLAGARVTEVVTNNRGCFPIPVAGGAGCPIGAGNVVTGCTDTYQGCGPPSIFPIGTCTEIITQQLFVGSCHAETRTITITITRTATTCSGTITRR